MVDGTISETEFDSFVRSFISVACTMNDNWQIRKSVDGKMSLCKSVNKLAVRSPPDKEELYEEEQFSEEDSSTLCQPPTDDDDVSSEMLTYEYHVVYSPSYGVPVLYFNAHRQNGSLLSLEEIWDSVPKHYKDRLEFERWTFITQQEHPILGRAFFQLHPCHTADLMAKVPTDAHTSNYIVSWLSAVGPVVGLELPLQYGIAKLA